ncbi:MAG: hypothetical protein FWG14_03380 [Peptococcaceae bacterium]|nr:hypothetical protein [Peptococcaceae bacterium]
MNLSYLKTNFPNGRSRILMRNLDDANTELHHFIFVLDDHGQLWVDVFWPIDEDAEPYTASLTEKQFWRIFREWRLSGISLGDNSVIAEVFAQKQMDRQRQQQPISM